MQNSLRETYCKPCKGARNIGDYEEEFKYKKNRPNFIEGFQTNAYSKLIVNPNDMDEVDAKRYRGGKIIVNPNDMDEVNTKKFKVNNTFWSVGVL